MGKINNLEQGTPKWHEHRAKHINGSEIPILMGLSPYQTEFELYQIKTGEKEQVIDPNLEILFQRGHQAETDMRQQLLDRDGILYEPAVYEHDEIKYFACSLDGISPDGKTIFEAKHTGADYVKSLQNGGDIRRDHLIQVQWNMGISGASKCLYFAQDQKLNGVVVEIDKDEEHIKDLFIKADCFWKYRLQAKCPPKLSERDTLILNDDGHIQLFNQLISAQEDLRKAQERFDFLKEKVSEIHNKIEHDGFKFSKISAKGSVQWKKIPEVKDAIKASEKALKDIKSELETVRPDYVDSFRGASSFRFKIEKIKTEIKTEKEIIA